MAATVVGMQDITSSAALIVALGIAVTALVRSLSGYIDAKSALLKAENLEKQNGNQEGRLASLENGGTDRRVKDILVQLGMLEKRPVPQQITVADTEYVVPERYKVMVQHADPLPAYDVSTNRSGV